MVPSDSRVMCSILNSVPSLPRPADTTRGSPLFVKPSTRRLAAICQSHSEAGISQPAHLPVAALREHPKPMHQLGEDGIAGVENRRKRNSIQASRESILEFLSSEFNLWRAQRTVSVYQSSISDTHPKIDSVGVGEHPLEVQLLKGAYNLRPPLPRYSGNWDVSLVVFLLMI